MCQSVHAAPVCWAWHHEAVCRRGSFAVQALSSSCLRFDCSSAVTSSPSCVQIDAATGEEQGVVSYNDKVGAARTLYP